MNNGFLSGLTNLTDLSSASPGGFTYVARYAGDLDIVVNALATLGRTTVLQRPRIQTTHAQSASFFSGSTVPYITSTYYGGYAGYSPSANYSQLEVGVGLDVTPFITPDGLVVMDINQTIDSLAGTTKIGNDEVPNTNTRTATSTVSVKDGEVIMLGGFITTSKTKSRSGVPFLKDIPGLGILFSSRSENNSRSELIILIKPTVLRSPHDAAEVAKRETETLPGVKQAQQDFIEQERKIAERANKSQSHKK
jgi:general secretion pathway protein D